MKTFSCRCGNRLFFDNSQCLRCNIDLGFSLLDKNFVALEEAGDKAQHPQKPCANYGRGLCNWMVRAEGPNDLCLACRLNVETPTDGESEALLSNVEKAKRRLVFSLFELGLPVVPKNENERGLAFALRRGTAEEPVITGHSDGLITLDLNEADPAKRAEIREALGEDYRTLLGHFRHEVGHYYWTLFFQDKASLNKFRAVFGDERADYGKALSGHYANPKQDFQDTHISSYATAHPWEDWAETWAHYLHILDGWDTALTFGLRTGNHGSSANAGFNKLLDGWSELMIALNSMNRSMGHDDAYPFAIAPEVAKKLCFVDETVRKNVARLHDQLSREAKPVNQQSAVA